MSDKNARPSKKKKGKKAKSYYFVGAIGHRAEIDHDKLFAAVAYVALSYSVPTLAGWGRLFLE